jgi:quinol-cytochrome oxidoreductase complex cytochrome b subunit
MVIQVATGVLLMVYYIPGLEAAHASILRINSQVDFGWFFRSIAQLGRQSSDCGAGISPL